MKKEQKITLPLTKKDLKLLPDIIEDDEDLITFIQSNGKPQGVLCLTNKRVLYLSKELNAKSISFGKHVGLTEITILLRNINSVRSKQQVLYGTAIITDSAQDYTFEKLTASELQRFVNLVKKQLNSPMQTKTQQAFNTPSNISSIDEIKKYKELLDLDIITKEEFDQKKKELLNL
ncbi:SHOCT domain-containing protein [Enterococcus sp. 5H]|uniref:SHOCT domain-containing protein n=1 Tax=Enterococcus sp. 5H TaxID=1229490 RepID=UPI0023047AE2|nr:PH domain-containing protein [Enterococcus sp. 5H]